MAKLVFILGGARSGKSSYALELAEKSKKKTIFLATAQVKDAEMKRRIKLHKKNRPKNFKTIEEPRNIIPVFQKFKEDKYCLILDCLTLFISNLIMEELTDKDIEKKIKDLIKEIKKSKSTVIIVSNEVGLGIVPDNPLPRRFRDLQGSCNRLISQHADEVFFMFSGIPVKIQGGSDNEDRNTN